MKRDVIADTPNTFPTIELPDHVAQHVSFYSDVETVIEHCRIASTTLRARRSMTSWYRGHSRGFVGGSASSPRYILRSNQCRKRG